MTMNLEDRLNKIKEGLKEASSRKLDVFGANRHEWKMNDPISNIVLLNIEKDFNVTFPEEYRRFLLEVGDGGAGPAYGLTPLRDSLKYFREKSYFDILECEFEHTEFFNDAESMVEADKSNFRGEITDEELDRIFSYSESGTIDICDLGCAFYIKLVISGPTRGQVWRDDSATDDGTTPLGMSFLDWYEDWLQTSLTSVSI